MRLTDIQRSTLARALTLETRFDAGMFPNDGGSHAHFRKLERMGLLAFDGWGRDIDGEVERDVLCYRLTDEGRRAAKSYPPGVPALEPVAHPDLDLLSLSHWPCDDRGRWCPGCKLFAWARKQAPGADRDALTGLTWSLLASNLVGPGDLP